MVEQISRVSEKSNGLLFAARIAAKDPDTINDLIEAARNLADSLNALLGLSAAQGPGLKECEDALRKIEVRCTLVLLIILNVCNCGNSMSLWHLFPVHTAGSCCSAGQSQSCHQCPLLL